MPAGVLHLSLQDTDIRTTQAKPRPENASTPTGAHPVWHLVHKPSDSTLTENGRTIKTGSGKEERLACPLASVRGDGGGFRDFQG